MNFLLSRATRVSAQWAGAAVQRAVRRFERDLSMTLSVTDIAPANRLVICLAPALAPESYTLDVTEPLLTLCAADDLGAVYGLLALSEQYLGVTPFWFWNEQRFEPKPFAEIPLGRATGAGAAVALRGWDLSDAPLLSGWADGENRGWEMAFEALLRCRGNMVRTAHEPELAAAMGLRLVQSPDAPLGAAPDGLQGENRADGWRAAVRRAKTLPRVWALGAADKDPDALSAALQRQYDLLTDAAPDAPSYLCLRGDAAAQYQEGRLRLPGDAVAVLPPTGSASGAGGPGPGARHGLWVSLCRRDALTGNPMTAFPDGADALGELLRGAWRGGVRGFWMLGAGDVRPHLLELALAGALWAKPETDVPAACTAYLRTAFRAPDGWALTDSALDDLSVCLRARAESAVQVGDPPRPMGEAFLTRPVRLFACAWLRGAVREPLAELADLLPGDTYEEQLAAYRAACQMALERYETLLPACSYAGRATTRLWQDQVEFGVRLYLYALRGAARFCAAREQFLAGQWKDCFCTLGRACDDYGAMAALPKTGSGLWLGFYDSGLLPDGALTGRVLAGLMALPRAAGDGPDYTGWQKALSAAPADAVPDFALYRALTRAESE